MRSKFVVGILISGVYILTAFSIAIYCDFQKFVYFRTI
jgi:hypothetical protein